MKLRYFILPGVAVTVGLMVAVQVQHDTPNSSKPKAILITAKDGPYKVRPDNPGGQQVPFQDFEIWNVLERKQR